MADNPRLEELRRRVRADPASIAFAALAEEFRRVGRYDEAVDTCRTGLLRHPAYLSARVTLGRALIETGDFDAAREELETVLRTAPENLAAIRGIAQIHERLGHSTEMDPHLAEMMRAMHAESIRAAAERPREPESAPAEPDIDLSLPPQPDPDVSLTFEPELAQPQGAPPLSLAPLDAARPVEVPTDPFAAFASIATPSPAPDFSFDLSPAISGGPPSMDLPMDSPIEPAGPDPKVLATLARLERFLGAIQSLRA